jgi:3-hydroxyisobutyrate dehydrogenase
MKVGFIGIGTMGGAMALNVLKAGHTITVYNRTRDREVPLADAGAFRADSPMAAARGADVVVICVSDTPDVETVLLGQNGVIHGAAPGTVVVDMSTISPAATRTMAEVLSEKGVAFLDAPVSGGSEGAKNGTLSIMVGGDREALDRVMPVLTAMGKTITHIGPVGSGQLTKAINQIIVAGTYWSVAEGMTLGLKAGLDMEKVIHALSSGAAGSWAVNHRASFMVKNDYPLGFKVSLHRKDLNIALGMARELGVALPVTAFVEQVESALIGRGHGDEDVSVMARNLREQSGIE